VIVRWPGQPEPTQIVEEDLMYDLVAFMNQLDLSE
jgi:hypothetical protein